MRIIYFSIIPICLLIGIFIAIVFLTTTVSAPENSTITETPQIDSKESKSKESEIEPPHETKKEIDDIPLIDAQQRITKKPFGIYITPETSPVQPERFSGYHTGTDFEIFSNEEDIAISVFAICEGILLEKRFVSGYGGIIVQSCQYKNETIAVLYGHLDISASKYNIGDSVQVGNAIATLGKGNSPETDGERKHLHLSIHRGSSIDYRGYVSNKSELSQWIDPENILKNAQ